MVAHSAYRLSMSFLNNVWGIMWKPNDGFQSNIRFIMTSPFVVVLCVWPTTLLLGTNTFSFLFFSYPTLQILKSTVQFIFIYIWSQNFLLSFVLFELSFKLLFFQCHHFSFFDLIPIFYWCLFYLSFFYKKNVDFFVIYPLYLFILCQILS